MISNQWFITQTRRVNPDDSFFLDKMPHFCLALASSLFLAFYGPNEYGNRNESKQMR